jgi:hypothetical protein
LLFLLCFFLLLVSWGKNTQGRNGKKPELGNQWDTQENGDERTGACVVVAIFSLQQEQEEPESLLSFCSRLLFCCVSRNRDQESE